MTNVISLPDETYEQLKAAWRRTAEVEFDIWLESEIEALLGLWDARWLGPLSASSRWRDVPVSQEVACTLNGIAIAERRAFEAICAAIAAQVIERADHGRAAAEPSTL